MIHMTILIEDTTIVATLQSVEVKTADGDETMKMLKWQGQCIDSMTGLSEKIDWTPEQMAAVLSLGLHAVGEDEMPGYDVDTLYNVAEKAVQGWHQNVRPIP